MGREQRSSVPPREIAKLVRDGFNQGLIAYRDLNQQNVDGIRLELERGARSLMDLGVFPEKTILSKILLLPSQTIAVPNFGLFPHDVILNVMGDVFIDRTNDNDKINRSIDTRRLDSATNDELILLFPFVANRMSELAAEFAVHS
jgi:hypothetical protein